MDDEQSQVERNSQILQGIPPKRLIRRNEPLHAHQIDILLHTARLQRPQQYLHVVPPVRGFAQNLHHERELGVLAPNFAASEQLVDELLLALRRVD